MSKGKKRTLIALLSVAVVLILAAAVLSVAAKKQQKPQPDGMVYVEDVAYPEDVSELDLRGTGISQEHYETLCGKLPECHVLWDVPFQGQSVPSNTETLTVSALTREDAEMLAYFPDLKELDATSCRDYEILMELLEKRPRCHISYCVEIGSQTFDRNTEEVELASGESSGEELMQRLPYLKKLKRVFLEEPQIPAEQLMQLQKTYPKIQFSWEKTLFGRKYDSSCSFLDLSGQRFSNFAEITDQTAYLPELQQVDMLNCGYSNEEMRAFRGQVREDFKVVWSVKVGTMVLRTDVLTFFPDRDHGKVKDKDTYNLRYCEDLVCVDVGHLGFANVDWVEGTPHLKYLIMSDGGAVDLTPLGQLQELEFLELFMTGVWDPSPLVSCKALRDLNLGVTPLGNITPLTKMTWLEKLWVNRTPLTQEEREILVESLPTTHIEFDEFYPTWGGWRDMPRYFDMRDVLGVPYMR